ncbi:hypothetical protein CDAR_371061 [Caerostris darwini]|uniref:Uncharacterized protein n=1 Tax=Caerostris darwini TaxID=1538125 RepID=A0AAV4QE85_9ARAC|nr:hypothetical protein CDAR_371061 [Caerostris darwini]
MLHLGTIQEPFSHLTKWFFCSFSTIFVKVPSAFALTIKRVFSSKTSSLKHLFEMTLKGSFQLFLDSSVNSAISTAVILKDGNPPKNDGTHYSKSGNVLKV